MTIEDPRSAVDAHLRFPWRERRDGAARQACAWPGCGCDGTHRAPRSPDQLRSYDWYCLEHVREYNSRWNYFAGKSEAEIDAHRRADTTWHRPTWRFGTARPAFGHAGWRDPFEFFDAASATPEPHATTQRMMAVLELDHGFSLQELRRQYKLMVKRWHPDLHGGSKAAEGRLRLVIDAYRYLKEHALGMVD